MKNLGLLRGSKKTIMKRWGHELFIANDQYCGKILEFKSSSCCSMHYHVKKKETLYILEGECEIEIIDPKNADREIFKMKMGDVLHIPIGLCHQVRTSTIGCKILEISTHHDDEDSFRVEKGDTQTIGK